MKKSSKSFSKEKKNKIKILFDIKKLPNQSINKQKIKIHNYQIYQMSIALIFTRNFRIKPYTGSLSLLSNLKILDSIDIEHFKGFNMEKLKAVSN